MLNHRRTVGVSFAACSLTLALVAGCGALSPGFESLLTGGVSQSLDNAPGHVVVQVVNNATVDERLLDFLDASLNLTDAEKRALRPRFRTRMNITFVDGSQQTIEFITGTANFIDPEFAATADTDLGSNDLSNAVVLCDVLSVSIDITDVEVFLPVEVVGFERVEVVNNDGGTVVDFQEDQRIPPSFRVLQTDDVDADLNVEVQRNIGIRDLPAPANNLLCGSVVAFVIDGSLSVPFLDGVSDAPSFDVDDENTVGSVGGRYRLRLAVQ